MVALFSYRTSTSPPASSSTPVAVEGKTFDGTLVTTRYGPIQVRISVANGKVTDVAAMTTPSGNPRTEQINAAAVPRLREMALSAQSAKIDTVSGATYSSKGYQQSLQAALDAAAF
ncbi:FMN-binding protein [Winogradskya humida]|uniref:FMN-binding protein n=1 Tax=Winogradskya humida TaxID=113566 RepID=UPI0027DB00DD|nr:FMN-binding protein [Actinoplanes humidus]